MNEITPRDLMLGSQLERFINSELGQYLRAQWAVRREILIQKGMKAKQDESARKLWGKLEGFDSAVSMVGEIIESIVEARNKDGKEATREKMLAGVE